MSDYSLFTVDSLTIDGVALPIVSSSVRITGYISHDSNIVPSASGADYESHSRVPRTIVGQIQFGPKITRAQLLAINGARAVLSDSRGPRRVLAPNCTLGRCGDLGAGPVDLTLNVLEEYVDL